MKNQIAKSAVKTHYLSSILPFNPTIIHEEQITKTKDFYKPQQCIWNNPHRTSKRMYQYYHKFNDTYIKQVKPKVDKLEEEDRRQMEKERISRLKNMRNQTRQKFYSRQKLRQDLQVKSGSRFKQHSTLQVKHNSPKDLKSIPYLTNYIEKPLYSNRDRSTKLRNKSERNIPIQIISVPQRSFLSGVQNYDQSLNQIRKLVSDQVVENRNRTRMKFQKRRQVNQITNSRIKRSSVNFPSKKDIDHLQN